MKSFHLFYSVSYCGRLCFSAVYKSVFFNRSLGQQVLAPRTDTANDRLLLAIKGLWAVGLGFSGENEIVFLHRGSPMTENTPSVLFTESEPTGGRHVLFEEKSWGRQVAASNIWDFPQSWDEIWLKYRSWKANWGNLKEFEKNLKFEVEEGLEMFRESGACIPPNGNFAPPPLTHRH